MTFPASKVLTNNLLKIIDYLIDILWQIQDDKNKEDLKKKIIKMNNIKHSILECFFMGKERRLTNAIWISWGCRTINV